MRKLFFLMFALGISACTKENTLLNQDTVESLKFAIDIMLSEKKAGNCPYYWAGKKDETFTPAFKALCNKEIKRDYKLLQKYQQALIKNATFEEFRDTRFWQMYLEVYK